MIDIAQLTKQHYDSGIANMPDFYLAKAQEALNAWRNLSIPDTLIDDLISLSYDDFKKKADTDAEVGKIRDCIFRLVSYCDLNAREKDIYNEYEDKRTVAKSGIYQDDWVVRWLKYKKDKDDITVAFGNLIDYIDHPECNFPILSEQHKEQLSRNLMCIPYNRESFASDLLGFFDKLGYTCVNPMNKTNLYAKMFYSFEDEWRDKVEILGLVACDRTDWKDDLMAGMASKPLGYGIMWRDKLPIGTDWTIKALKRRIKQSGSFDFYIAENNITTYKATVVDFSKEGGYEKKRDGWQKLDPFWFAYDFSKYCAEEQDGTVTQRAKIAYLLKDFREIPANERVNIKTHFDLLNEPRVANYAAFTGIKTDADIMNNNIITSITDLLTLKKNVILQGAPGTGKTYITASVALKILGVSDINFTTEKDVMDRYESLVDDGRIAFTTFHQSMDYEDFVEGYKPEEIDGQVQFKLKPGIFRRICEKAKTQPCVLIIDEINRGNISKIFGELITLLESDKRDGGKHKIPVNLTYSDKPFSVPDKLYIIGTMNTTDRSVGSIDYALRRRFAFKTLKSDPEVIKGQNIDNTVKAKALALYEKVESFLNANPSDMKMEDLMPGHSYFMAKTIEELDSKVRYELIPLVEEYAKDGIIEVSNDKLKTAFEEWKQMIK